MLVRADNGLNGNARQKQNITTTTSHTKPTKRCVAATPARFVAFRVS